MKRLILLIAVGLGLSLPSYSQSLERNLISSYGALTNSSIQVFATLGEVIVSSEASVTIILNQGFQQTGTLASNIFEDFKGNAQIRVFPNPSKSEITIEASGKYKNKLNYKLYDLHGKLIKYGDLADLQIGEKSTLNLEALAAGTYLLLLQSKTETYNRSIKIIKQE